MVNLAILQYHHFGTMVHVYVRTYVRTYGNSTHLRTCRLWFVSKPMAILPYMLADIVVAIPAVDLAIEAVV